MSREVVRSDSRCAINISNAWDDVIHESSDEGRRDKIEYRLVFTAVKSNAANLKSAMGNMRVMFPKVGCQKGFYFLPCEFQPSQVRELPTISNLRHMMFRHDYLSVNNFCDIPQTILIFTIGDEFPELPSSHNPPWAADLMSVVPKNLVKYDPSNLKSVLRTFLNTIVSPRFRDALARCEQEFVKSIVMTHALDNAKLRQKPLSEKHAQVVKKYADYQIMAGKHSMAYSLYQQLVDHFPDQRQTAKLRSALMGAISCDIIIGETNSRTIDMLKRAIQYAESVEIEFLLRLIHFWVLPRVMKPSIDPIRDFVDKHNATELYSVVAPFLDEQRLHFCDHKQIAYGYRELANAFARDGFAPHMMRCMWNCWSVLKESNLMYAQFHVMETMVSFLLREPKYLNQPKPEEEWILADEIGYLMQYCYFPRMPVFVSYLSLSNPRKSYPCGFVRCSLVSYSLANSLKHGPTGFTGNWYATSQKLFGAHVRDNFFSRTSLVTDEIGVGDTIRVLVHISNLSADFHLNKCRIRIPGDSAVSSEIDCDATEPHMCEFIIQAKQGGTIDITGVEFNLVSNVNLYSLFRQRTISLFCQENAPIVAIDPLFTVHEMMEGEAIVLPVVLHVGNINLSSLSLFMEGDTDIVTLLSPDTSDVGGQFFFGKQVANTEVRVVLLISAMHVGTFSNWMFFSFKSEENLFRYQHLHLELTVYENSLDVPMFPAFSNGLMEVKIRLKYAACGHYQVLVSNNCQTEIGPVEIELLDGGSSCSYIISGVTKKRFEKIRQIGTVSFSFALESLDHEIYPVMCVTTPSGKHYSDLSVYMQFYDRL